MEDIANQFFNKDERCPYQITNCLDLRNEYFSTLEDFKSKHGCTPCVERHVRNLFLTRIRNILNEK
jgi:hypothetical protein